MTLKEFLLSYAEIDGTSLQKRTSWNELIKRTEIELSAFVFDVHEGEILLYNVLNENDEIESSLKFQSDRSIVVKYNQSQTQDIININKDNLIRIKCTPIIDLGYDLPGYQLIFNMVNFKKIDYAKIRILNRTMDEYDCFVDGEFRKRLKMYDNDGSNELIFFVSNKRKYLFSVKQKKGFTFYPSVYENEFVYTDSNKSFYWAFPDGD